MNRLAYPTDLTDVQWSLIEPLLPVAKPGGRPRTVNLREVVNGINYLSRSGCAGRLLPHDLPPWGRYIGIIGSGGGMGRGSDCMTRCAGKSGNRLVGRPRRVPRSLTVRRSRRLKKGGSGI